LQNCVHMHSLATLENVTASAQVIYKGFMGDALLGYGQSRAHWANIDDEHFTDYQFQIHLDQSLILFTFDQAEQLFTENNRLRIRGKSLESYRNSLSESDAILTSDQRHYFDIYKRVPRMTLNGVELVRSRASVRMPFCDRDLVEFALSMPAGLRSERYLMVNAFIQAFPEMAKVPYTATGLPMASCIRSWLMQGDNHLRWYLRNKGLKWVPVRKKTSYIDYDGWMRTNLKKWVEDILLDKKTLDRDYFKPEVIRNLVSEHMDGDNNAAKLGALISLELWHRLFID
jgi:asparagine synthetase B (glutamine-hydrolysing)